VEHGNASGVPHAEIACACERVPGMRIDGISQEIPGMQVLQLRIGHKERVSASCSLSAFE